jgi:hypothetical protein
MFGALLVAYAVIAFFFISGVLRLSAHWRLEDSGRVREGEKEEEAPEESVPYGPSAA